MREVIENESEDHEAADHHRTGSEGGFDMLLFLIGHRPGTSIIDRQTNREIDVEDHGHEEKDADDPEKRSERAQMFRVTVDPLRPEKDLQIAEQMADDERDQDDAGGRHDELLSDRRAIKRGDLVHDYYASVGPEWMAETRSRES